MYCESMVQATAGFQIGEALESNISLRSLLCGTVGCLRQNTHITSLQTKRTGPLDSLGVFDGSDSDYTK